MKQFPRSEVRKAAILSEILGISAAFLVSGASLGNERDFYFDAKTNRYFSDGKPKFSIRSLEDPKYVDKIEVSVDGDDFRTYEGKLTLKEEGAHAVRFRAADPLANWSPLQEFRIFVDLSPPSSFPSWQGPTYQSDDRLYVSLQAKLILAGQDSLSGIARVRWDNDGKPKDYSAPIQFKADGQYVLRYSAVDNVGNEEEWHPLKFVADGKAPASNAEVAGNTFKTSSGIFVNSGNQIVLTAKDESSGVELIEYQIDSGPVLTYRGPIAVSLGKLELRYRATDRVGNAEAWKTVAVVQDTLPPRLAIEKTGAHLASRGKLYGTLGLTLEARASDDASGLQEVAFSENGKDYKRLPQGKHIFVQPGEHQLSFRATDQVGNVTQSEPFDVVIDNVPPKTEMSSLEKLVPVEGAMLSPIPNRIELRSLDDGAGVAATELSYDGKTWAPVSGPIDLATWPQARRTVFYRSVDRLGNKEPPHQVTIQLRNDLPKVDLFVESEKLPDVPLSSLQNGGREAAPRAPAVSTPAPAPAPKAAAKKKVRPPARKRAETYDAEEEEE